MTDFQEVIQWIRDAKANKQNTHLLVANVKGTDQHIPINVRHTDNKDAKIREVNATPTHKVVEVIDLSDPKLATI